MGAVVKFLKNLWTRVRHPLREAALRRLTPVMAESVRDNFTHSHGPDGTPWSPLKYREGKPLILTGDLMAAAIAAVSNPHIDDGRWTATLSDPAYGLYHQFGTGRIPARPFFGISEQAEETVAGRVEQESIQFIVNGEKA